MNEWIPLRSIAPWLPQQPYLVDPSDLTRLRSVLRAAGFALAETDVDGAADERAFLGLLGGALGFPDYYRPNWDGFDDCVGDLMRDSAEPIAVLIENSDEMLRANQHAFVRSVHLLQDVVESVSQDHGCFRLEVFFHRELDAEVTAARARREPQADLSGLSDDVASDARGVRQARW